MTTALANGAIDIRPVTDRSGLKAFIDLPNQLYGAWRGYVPPLGVERDETLNTAKNAYFQHAKARYWLALRDGRPVGRISAQVDRLHLERYGDDTGHFGLLDAEDDPAVFDRLLETAEAWLEEQGMTQHSRPFQSLDQRGMRSSGGRLRASRDDADAVRPGLCGRLAGGPGIHAGQGPPRLCHGRRRGDRDPRRAHAGAHRPGGADNRPPGGR